MTSNDPFIDRLEDYLDSFDGTTPLPQRTRDAIHAALPRTRQAPARRGPMGVLRMATRSSTARWGVAAAAVVAAVVLGAAVLNGGRTDLVGGPPAATPTATPTAAPTPTATPAPTPTAATGTQPLSSALSAACYPEATRRDCIAPGTYSLTGTIWPAEISLDVPAGWFTYFPGAGYEGVLVDSGPDAPEGSGWGVMFSVIGSVSRDPCNDDAGTYAPEKVDTALELAAAIAAWPGFESSEPVEVTVAGSSGLLVEVTSARAEADCPGQVIWLTPASTPVEAYPMVGAPDVRRAATFRILEVGDQLLAIRTTEFGDISPHEANQGVAPDPSRHEADLVELQAILDSIRIEPWPAQE